MDDDEEGDDEEAGVELAMYMSHLETFVEQKLELPPMSRDYPVAVATALSLDEHTFEPDLPDAMEPMYIELADLVHVLDYTTGKLVLDETLFGDPPKTQSRYDEWWEWHGSLTFEDVADAVMT